MTVVRSRADTRANLEIIARDGTVTEILEPGGGVTDGEVDRLLFVCCDIFAESREGSQVALSGSLAVACGTSNCPAESPGLVDPLEVERIMQQVSVQSLQPGWREVKTQGGAG